MWRAPDWVSAVARNDAEEVRRICERSGDVPLWRRKKCPTYNLLGWAIECKHPGLTRSILRWRPELSACYIERPWGQRTLTPLEWACAMQSWHALEALLELGLPITVWRNDDTRRCERNVKARRAALFVLGVFRKTGLLRDVCVLIARAVYATRIDVAWFYCIK